VQDDKSEGELAFRREARATNLYSVDRCGSEPWCSHAHRRRSSGAAGPFYRTAGQPCAIAGHRHLGSL